MIEGITISALIKMFESFGGSIDFKSKTFSLKWWNFEIKGIPFPWISALAKDQSLIEKLVSEHFIKKQIMWFDFKLETTAACVGSLNLLIQKLEDDIKSFSKSSKDADKLAASQLQALENIATESLKEFNESIRAAKASQQEYDSSESWSSEEDIPKILSKFRIESYPIIKFFTELLPKENIVRKQTELKIDEGESILIKYYNTQPKSLINQELKEE